MKRNILCLLVLFGFLSALHLSAAEVIPSITVLNPKGGEKWRVGSTNTISWSSIGLDASERVWIVITSKSPTGDGFEGILSVAYESQPQTGSYSWTIPQRMNEIPGIFLGFEYVAGTQYKILVGRMLTSGLLDPIGESLPFTIVPPISMKNFMFVGANADLNEPHFQFEVRNVEIGKEYKVESSADIKEWKIFGNIGTYKATTENFIAGGVLVPPNSLQFFRIVELR